MEKLIYLLRGGEGGDSLRDALIAAAPVLERAGASKIAVNVNDSAVEQGEGVRIRKLDPPICAMVSFWMDNADDRHECEKEIGRYAPGISGHLVVESVPVANETFVPEEGERTPGVNIVTCIHRLPQLTYHDFWRIWYNDHKIVARETQATFAYVRNTVVRPLTENALPCDGIVEESFPIDALVDPKVWYDAGDSDEVYRQRLQRMIASVQRFLDLDPLESHPMSQYLLD